MNDEIVLFILAENKCTSVYPAANETVESCMNDHETNVIRRIRKGDINAFEQIVDYGVLAREPCVRLKVSLVDTKLHEDAIHRGPAQVLPAVRDAIRLCILDAKPILFEPIQQLRIDTPERYINDVTRIVQSRRGQMMGIEQEEDRFVVNCTLPVGEMFGLSNELRSSTEGRANFFLVNQSFSRVPSDLQDKIVRQIRQRKGLTEAQ